MSLTKKKRKEYLKICNDQALKMGRDLDGDIFYIKGKIYCANLILNKIRFVKSLKKKFGIDYTHFMKKGRI